MDVASFNSHFKGFQVQLPCGTFGEDRIHCVKRKTGAASAVGFLLVDGKMLGAGGNRIVFFCAPADRYAADACQHRIFGKVFEIPSADGTAVQVQRRGEPAVNVLGEGFVAAGASEIHEHLWIKAAGQQHTGGPGCLADAGGTVLIKNRRDPVFGEGR